MVEDSADELPSQRRNRAPRDETPGRFDDASEDESPSRDRQQRRSRPQADAGPAQRGPAPVRRGGGNGGAVPNRVRQPGPVRGEVIDLDDDVELDDDDLPML